MMWLLEEPPYPRCAGGCGEPANWCTCTTPDPTAGLGPMTPWADARADAAVAEALDQLANGWTAWEVADVLALTADVVADLRGTR